MVSLAERARNLPPELISRIIDYLELYSLFALLATSRCWRRVALDHPTFWRDLQLSSSSDGAINFFILRLEHARERRILVKVEVPRPCQRISDEVIPALAARMSHIRALRVHVHHNQAAALFPVLELRAPELKRLRVSIATPPQTPLAVLPNEIFRGYAPALKSVAFHDVNLVGYEYFALRKVEVVEYALMRKEAFYSVPRLFVLCPRMRTFGLHAHDVNVPADLKFRRSFPRHVQALDCTMKPSVFEFMSAVIPFHAIPSIRWLTDTNVQALIGHLTGELTMKVVDRRREAPELFEIRVTSTITQFTRTFSQSARRYLAGVKPPISFLRDTDFAERLVTLTLPNALWGFLTPHLLPFPNLLDLCVRMDSPSLPALGSKWSIVCPALLTLRLSASTVDPLYVTADSLTAFATISLSELPPAPQPSLLLHAVILEGDCYMVKHYFRFWGTEQLEMPSFPQPSHT